MDDDKAQLPVLDLEVKRRVSVGTLKSRIKRHEYAVLQSTPVYSSLFQTIRRFVWFGERVSKRIRVSGNKSQPCFMHRGRAEKCDASIQLLAEEVVLDH